ncbi:insulinase family protein [Candidatus Amesbacteria bacterium]|nr:insulinase family protein [Candidatus Amesbacteria bacterium]
MTSNFYYLDNGVRVMLVPISGVQSVAIGVYVRAGTRDETLKNNGIAHFLEHIVFKGSKNYPTPESLMVLESTGGFKNAGTSQEYTMYEAKLPSDKLDLGLSVLSDIVLYPLLDSKALENEKKTIIEEIKRRNDQSEELVVESFYHDRFQNLGLKLKTLGTENSIKSLSRDQFDVYHQKYYTSANIVICVSGKFDNNFVKLKISQIFSKLPKSPTITLAFPKTIPGPQIFMTERPSDEQIQLVLGGEAFGMTDKRRFALSVLFRVLNFGLSGRLFKATRIDRNLVYNIHAGADLDSDHGSWLVMAGVSKNNLSELIQVILKELKLLRDVPLEYSELADAKEKVRVPTLFSLESPLSQMEWYAQQALFRPQEILTHAQAIEKVMAVTAEDVQNVARDLFKTENLYLSLVGPTKKGDLHDRILKI